MAGRSQLNLVGYGPLGQTAALKPLVGNEAVDCKQTYKAAESPVSELREDVVDAVSEAVETRYPTVPSKS